MIREANAAEVHTAAASLAEPYWKRVLAGEVPETPVMTDLPRSPDRRAASARVPLEFPAELSARIARIAKGSELSVFLLLTGGLGVVLSRYTGHGDIIVGSPLYDPAPMPADRGPRVVPLRLIVREDASFRELLLATRQAVLGAYAHQDCAFSRLVELAGRSAMAGRNPLFDVLVAHAEIHDFADLRGVGNDLSFLFRSTGERLTGEVSFDPTLFRESTMARLGRHFLHVLGQCLADVNDKLERIRWLAEAEERSLLRGFNDNARPYPTDSSFDRLLARQAAATPDRVAAVASVGALSYGELDARAGQLAGLLRELGIGPGRFVGVLLPRGLELLVSILAVFKAGGAYVPIEPGYPLERVRAVLADSEVSLLVSETPLLARFREVLSAGAARRHLIALDGATSSELWGAAGPQALGPDSFSARSREAAPAFGSARAPLYMIYTSGSTGVPKGAIVRHDGAINHNYARLETLGFHPGSGFLQTAAISTDISVWQLLAPLLCGGRTIVADDAAVYDPALLLETIARERPTLVELVPVQLRSLLETAAARPQGAATLAGLDWMIVTGEALPVDLVARWFELVPGVRLVNCYGPTEASDDVTQLLLAGPLEAGCRSVPIGRPLPNLNLYVLDRWLRPVAVGVPGEICVGGIGVGDGYWKKPEKTAVSFVPNPFAERPGGVLYRTGDLGRWLEDGSIEFLGRIDGQVKIRGFRIEVGEIESALADHPEVRESVVVAREDTPAVKRLVAYIVPADERLGVPDLQSFLAARLPQQMLPAAYVSLPALPRTANGKVDRRRLPAPDPGRPQAGSGFVAPRNPREARLAAIWAEVLGVERIGVHDNFFHLGGDSILSIQVAAKVSRGGDPVTPQDLFRHPTIAELAAQAAGKRCAAEQGPVAGPVPLTPIQHWFVETVIVDPGHWNQSMLFELSRPLDPALLEKAVKALLAHHDALRLCLRREPDGWSQTVLARHPGGAFHLCDLSQVAPAERRATLEAKAAAFQSALAPERGDLLRCVWFDLGEGEPARLLLVFHHLAVDAVSWRLLLEDLQLACEQLAAGQSVALPAKTTSFKRWAERLSEHAQSPSVDDELPYWQGLATTADVDVPLDGDADRAANLVMFERAVSVSLDPQETGALIKELPKLLDVGTEDLLLAALAQALAPWRGDRPLLIDLESHGREDLFGDVDLSHTVGWFTSVHPFLLAAPTGSAVGAAMRVREERRQVPGKGLGFGSLRHLNRNPEVARQLADFPRPAILFNYLGQLDAALPANSPWQPAGESTGSERSPRGPRSHLFEVQGSVFRQQLRLRWTYNSALHRPATVERLVEAWREALRLLIREARAVALAPTVARPRPVPLKPSGWQALLFCVHPAGGGVLCYRDLARHLAARQPVYGLEAPGFHGERSPCHRLEDLASYHLDVLRAFQPDGPYRLAGVSFGGFVAFEMAQQLAAQGTEVDLLALLDTWSPTYLGKPAVELDLAEELVKLGAELVRPFGARLELPASLLRGLRPAQQVQVVIDEIVRSPALPAAIDLGKLRRKLEIEQCHHIALVRYRPRVYPGRITLFRAPLVPRIAHLEKHPAREDRARGWTELSCQPIEVHDVSGDHQTMMFEPLVKALAEPLQRCLDRTPGREIGLQQISRGVSARGAQT